MDFLEPRKLHLPELDQEITFPFESANETFVLLNVATIKQIPVKYFYYLWPFGLLLVRCWHQVNLLQSLLLSVEGLEVSSLVCLEETSSVGFTEAFS